MSSSILTVYPFLFLDWENLFFVYLDIKKRFLLLNTFSNQYSMYVSLSYIVNVQLTFSYTRKRRESNK